MEAQLLLAQPSPLPPPPSSLPCVSSLAEGQIRICQGGLFHITQSKSGPSVSPFVHHPSGSDVGKPTLSISRCYSEESHRRFIEGDHAAGGDTKGRRETA